MFGYIRPFKAELKVKEFEAFRGVYCGLCHALRRRCGFAARFVVNYDFTFMAMLLSEETSPCFQRKRCVVSPIRGRSCACVCGSLDDAADRSVILTYWKLCDAVKDSGFFRSLRPRLARAALSFGYRKARKAAPDFDAVCRDKLSRLSALEEAKCPSVDQTADCFAAILRALAAFEPDEARARALAELFYHAGRIIYILDAVDDLPEDVKTGSYNPLLYRFTPELGALRSEDRETLRLSVENSRGRMIAAYQLLSPSAWSPILENILLLGIPEVSRLVFLGQWGKKTDKPSEMEKHL